jgi:cell division protein FtsA
LRFLPELVEYHTGMNARLGIPVEHLAHGYDKEVMSPVYSTAIGLVLKGIDDIDSGRVSDVQNNSQQQSNQNSGRNNDQNVKKGPTFFSSMFKKAREWFESEPDGDLK